jgi:hypothetical protein
MPFPYLEEEGIVVGEKAIMFAEFTPLSPKEVTIFSEDSSFIQVVAEDDTLYKFPRDSKELRTEAGYVWQLRKWDSQKFIDYAYKLEELKEVRAIKKEIQVNMDIIYHNWKNIYDLDKIRKIAILVDIAREQIREEIR